jgi:hypothetical protein
MFTGKSPRLAWQLLLALLMLLMQQGALRHGLQHITGEDSAPTHSLCKDCLSFHAADQTLASAPLLSLPPVALPELPYLWASSDRLALLRTGYRSRAPPDRSA